MSATPAFRRKWGKYLPHQRANVDQVPLPFVNGMDETYEQVGAKRVAINQNGPSLAKRQATGQVCFRGVLPEEPDEPVWGYNQYIVPSRLDRHASFP